jgi:tRNA dimethylallyltransferase
MTNPRAAADAPRPFALVGPTAAGKTEASLTLAEALDAEIVSVDSMLVYAGMDVGTAKPRPSDLARVPHHLIDVAEPSEPFSAARFQALAGEALADVRARGKAAVLVGGSGLYFRAVVDRLRFPGTSPRLRGLLEAEAVAVGTSALHRRLAAFDPEASARIEPGNTRRVVRALEVAALTGRPFSSFARAWDTYPTAAVVAAGVDLPSDVLHRRIEARVEAMMPGLVAETAALLGRGRSFDRWLTATQAIGYAEAAEVLRGRITEDRAVAKTTRRTKALARRQRSWFRRDPRIRWFPVGAAGAVEAVDAIPTYYRQEDAARPAALAERARQDRARVGA